MASAPLYLGFILILTLPNGISVNTNFMDSGAKGLFIGNRYFLNNVQLPYPAGKLKYVFILIKHAMSVPEYKTYPGDKNYQRQWKVDKATQHGRSLMLMIGRSLRTRYSDFLKIIPFWDGITISSINKEDVKIMTGDLAYGLLKRSKYKEQLGKDLSWLVTDQSYDKIQKILPISDQCIWMKSLREEFGKDKVAGPPHFTRCSESLYTTLQTHIKIENDNDQEWKIDNPEKVYKLWTMLIFEILQGYQEPDWAKEDWTWIQSCVFENYRKLLSYHPAIPAMISGRLIHQMDQEVGSDVFLHVHVSNDIAVMNMNWTLPNSVQSHWPDPGDALIYDFYTDNTVEVSSFSAWQGNYDKLFRIPHEEFFQEYKKRYTYLTEEEWYRLCNYNGKNTPGVLFADPGNPSEALIEYRQLYGYRQKG